jgi:hypothetical protein
MLVVAFSHVCEALQILPWMRFGGRFLDLFGSAQSLVLRCSRLAFFSMLMR